MMYVLRQLREYRNIFGLTIAKENTYYNDNNLNF